MKFLKEQDFLNKNKLPDKKALNLLALEKTAMKTGLVWFKNDLMYVFKPT
jgi:hypothetical protein